MSTAPVTMRELLDAGVHFGHQTHRWHPHMKPYLYGERNGIHIIDLQESLPRFKRALEFLIDCVSDGGTVLFVGTKRQAQDVVAEKAQSCDMPFVHRRWLGGMLTNFRTIRRGVDRLKELTELLSNEDSLSALSKKDTSKLTREHRKLMTAFEGIQEMERVPDAMFIIDIRKETIALAEARRLGIPVVAVVDSNCNPDGVDYPIPGNDDAIRAISLYLEKCAEACQLGREAFNERIVEEGKAAAQAPVQEEESAPAVGKRVVEITQPARRPARLERMAAAYRDDAAKPAEAKPTEAEPAEAKPTEAESTEAKPAEAEQAGDGGETLEAGAEAEAKPAPDDAAKTDPKPAAPEPVAES